MGVYRCKALGFKGLAIRCLRVRIVQGFGSKVWAPRKACQLLHGDGSGTASGDPYAEGLGAAGSLHIRQNFSLYDSSENLGFPTTPPQGFAN